MLLPNSMERSVDFGWCLRSLGRNPRKDAHILEDGMVLNYGTFVGIINGGCPTMWVRMITFRFVYITGSYSEMRIQ